MQYAISSENYLETKVSSQKISATKKICKCKENFSQYLDFDENHHAENFRCYSRLAEAKRVIWVAKIKKDT